MREGIGLQLVRVSGMGGGMSGKGRDEQGIGVWALRDGRASEGMSVRALACSLCV